MQRQWRLLSQIICSFSWRIQNLDSDFQFSTGEHRSFAEISAFPNLFPNLSFLRENKASDRVPVHFFMHSKAPRSSSTCMFDMRASHTVYCRVCSVYYILGCNTHGGHTSTWPPIRRSGVCPRNPYHGALGAEADSLSVIGWALSVREIVSLEISEALKDLEPGKHRNFPGKGLEAKFGWNSTNRRLETGEASRWQSTLPFLRPEF